MYRVSFYLCIKRLVHYKESLISKYFVLFIGCSKIKFVFYSTLFCVNELKSRSLTYTYIIVQNFSIIKI